MIRRCAELEWADKTAIRGGAGPAQGADYLEKDEMAGILSAGRTILEAGSSIGEHTHPNTEELYLVLDGHGRGVLDGETFPVGPGDLFLLCAIRDLGPNAYSLIPLLVKNLQHPNAFAASMNARTLGELKLDPGLVVPALTRCLQDPRADLRGEAARALAEFGSRARLALPALTNALADSESEVRVKAGLATQRNAPDDHTNASTL